MINAISHAINEISDKCDKSDTYHTCNIASLIPFPPPPRGTQNRQPERRCQGRDDDAAVDRDGNVDIVTRPVSVTTINTTDGNAASLDSEMVGWGGDRHATGVADALDSGEGRGIAGATTTTPMGGPGNDDVEAVGRFRRAGRR